MKQNLFKIFLFNLIFVSSVCAEEAIVSGHFKHQYSSSRFASNDLLGASGSRQLDDQEIDFRLNYLRAEKAFEVEISGEVLGLFGESQEKTNRIPFAGVRQGFFERNLSDDNSRLLDLSYEISERDDYQVLARLDRLSLGYLGESLVLKLGRQAISWGGGLAFQVLDLFNPFAPAAIDKDYKTGDDMLYLQWLATGGGDLQILVVPRRDAITNSILSTESSYAAKWKGMLGSVDYDIVAALHYDEFVLGSSVALTYLDAIWRVDASGGDREDDSFAWSFLLNVDRSFVVYEKNVYVFLEYYHNGYGVSKSEYPNLTTDLSERLDRGELYSIGENYFAYGLNVELAPRLNTAVSQFLNLGDSSGFFQSRTELELSQDLVLLLGVNVPYGSGGSEFGGLELGNSGLSAGQSWSLFSRLSLYF